MKLSSFDTRFLLVVLLAGIAVAGCDHGLAPPAEPETGVVRVHVEYLQSPEDWPPPDSLRDLRFVAMRFVPRDTSDLLQLNRLVFSERLSDSVSSQVVILPAVETGPFLYAGVAQKFGPDIFDWRPIGLVTDNGGIFVVATDETTDVSVVADFGNPPPFPPPLP